MELIKSEGDLQLEDNRTLTFLEILPNIFKLHPDQLREADFATSNIVFLKPDMQVPDAALEVLTQAANQNKDFAYKDLTVK